MTISRFDRLAPRGVLLALAVATALTGCQEDTLAEGAIAVPSGREVGLIDVITDVPGPEGQTARFRFLAPGLAAGDAETAAEDMQALCESYAIPRLAALSPPPVQVIVSLSAENVPFGQAAPDVTQLFEAYRVDGDTCIWVPF